MIDRTPRYEYAIDLARELIDDGTNVEYVRGIVELMADLYGYGDEPDGEAVRARIMYHLGLIPASEAPDGA